MDMREDHAVDADDVYVAGENQQNNRGIESDKRRSTCQSVFCWRSRL